MSIPGIAVLITGLWSPSETKKRGSYQFKSNFIIDATPLKKVKGKRVVTFCMRKDVISEKNKCKGLSQYTSNPNLTPLTRMAAFDSFYSVNARPTNRNKINGVVL